MNDKITKMFYNLVLRGIYILIMKSEGKDNAERVQNWGEDVLGFTRQLDKI